MLIFLLKVVANDYNQGFPNQPATRPIRPTRPNLTQNHLIRLLQQSDLGPDSKNPTLSGRVAVFFSKTQATRPDQCYLQIRPTPAISSLDSRRSGEISTVSGKIELRFEEIWQYQAQIRGDLVSFSRNRHIFQIPAILFFSFFFSYLKCFLHSDDPNPARPMLTLTRNQLDQFYGGSSLGSSALHPTPAGQVQVGSKPNSWTALITTKFVAKFCHI